MHLLAPIIAQNGIQVSRGASAQVRGNTVMGNSYTGSSFASSGGILIFGGCGDPLVTGVQVMGNTLIYNDVGIYLNNFTDDCSAPATTMTNDKAVNNTVSNDAVTNVGERYLFTGFPTRATRRGLMTSAITTRSSTTLSLVLAIPLLRLLKAARL